MVFSLSQELESLGRNVPDQVQRRLNRIRKVLWQTYQTKLRDDSVLAWNYANNNIPGYRFSEIVFRLLLQRYLCEYTPYETVVAQVIDKRQHHLPVDTKTLRHWILPLAQLRTLRQVGLPNQWPWLLT